MKGRISKAVRGALNCACVACLVLMAGLTMHGLALAFIELSALAAAATGAGGDFYLALATCLALFILAYACQRAHFGED